jgi:lipoprotein-releasing system permease protein
MMFLSIRHLMTRKKQTLLILLGIVMGTSAYVTISGMMLGFQTRLLEELVNNDAHIRISAREELLTAESMGSFEEALHVFWTIPPSGRKDSVKIEYPIAWFEKLDRDPDVVAYSPQVYMNVIFNRGKVTQAGRMIGSDPFKQSRVTNIDQYMTEGSFKNISTSGNHVLLGKALLDKLGAKSSETIYISSGKDVPRPFKIVGIFDTGNKNIDEVTAFASLTDTQKLRGTPSEITDIAVKVSDPYNATAISQSWKNSEREKIQSWEEASATMLSVFKTQDIVRNSMTISIIIVASFGIYNILSILVNQKKRDIAILRSMGYTPGDIINLFFNQGLILGVIGGITGLILGYIFCRLIGMIEIVPGRMGSNLTHMIISYAFIIYIKAFVIAVFSSIISSILPARQAGKMEPVDIIRSGGQ